MNIELNEVQAEALRALLDVHFSEEPEALGEAFTNEISAGEVQERAGQYNTLVEVGAMLGVHADPFSDEEIDYMCKHLRKGGEV